ncbi:hypothetical protein AC578_8877 [Lecanosticta acicola]|uniref:G-patch domain-containing protein n=1 Tax=Lecanosticta acicola TaxID=111012 RepID=A0AAI8Z7M1_9PEZI|nr:hypothetical protein AC578_8877 [Lecanosticta acicola]
MAEAPKKGRLTLYEDLLSEETRAEIAAKDAQSQAEEAKKKKDASILFKPTHLGKKTNKVPAKPKATFASAHKFSSSTSTTAAPLPTATSPETQHTSISSTPQQPQAPSQTAQKRGFDDWLANEEDEWNYYAHKPDRGVSRKKKKRGKQTQEQSWSWGDVYDPHTPVSFLDYPKSEVQFDINEQWKERLYSARKRERQRQGKEAKRSDSDDPASRNRKMLHVRIGMQLTGTGQPPNMEFAPPGSLHFAPPAECSSDAASRPQSTGTSSPYPARDHPSETGEEAFNRPMAMSMTPAVPVAPSPPVPAQIPPVSASPASAAKDEAQARAAAQIAAFKAKLAAQQAQKAAGATPPVAAAPEPQVPSPASGSNLTEDIPPPPPPESQHPAAASAQSVVVSAAPTYNPEYARMKAQQEAVDAQEPEQQDKPADVDAPRSNRPGQLGFAEKYMKKHGHQQGQGLGAQADGIITPIMLQQNKRKKRPDAEGGGFAAPATGRIVGGKRAKTAAHSGDGEGDAEAAQTKMSEVVKIEDMLANLDVDQEIQNNDLLQEIGEEMGTYGTVERLFIWRQHAGGNDDVFVKYTSPLSALNAIKACDGQEFADNVMKARFWDVEKFEQGEYA